jgi:hypothetical protein
MSSSTSDPMPRTCLDIEPRLTVSIHTPLRSTVGAAGLRRARAIVPAASVSAIPEMTNQRLRRR